jgi:hypothetical protein
VKAGGLVLLGAGGLLALGILGVSAGMGITGVFTWDAAYQREIHGHMSNAYYADTPELMKDELQQAVQAMHAAGLDGQYDSLAPWHHVPNEHMDYQYKHLQSVVDRCNDIIEWRKTSGSGTQATDVYEAKMRAVRDFIRNDGGWSDDVAHGAYFVVHHKFVSFWSDFWMVPVGLFLVGTLLAVGGAFLAFREV